MLEPHFQSCIDSCNTCADICDSCAKSCLEESDVKALTRCIALDIDCALTCRLAAGFMSRDSELAGLICQVCADVCDTCAEECARHAMEHCQECASACRLCATECRRMSGMAPRAQRGLTSALGTH